MLRNFAELKQKVLANKEKKVIALACAADKHSLEALRDAHNEFGSDFLLIGDIHEIVAWAANVGFQIDKKWLVQADTAEQAAEIAVESVRLGKADILMKGKMQTSDLLRAVVNKENGIRQGGLMSHLAVLESPDYHKLMYITDGGMVIGPSLEQKKGILENAVSFLHKLGYEMPKAAALAAVETVNEKMPETIDAKNLAVMSGAGEFEPHSCIVEGPMSFDLAISKESAKIKGIDSRISGDTDIFLAPDMAVGNILSKALIYLGNAKMAGCILGAKAPIILVSRGASAEEKMLSILLTMAV